MRIRSSGRYGQIITSAALIAVLGSCSGNNGDGDPTDNPPAPNAGPDLSASEGEEVSFAGDIGDAGDGYAILWDFGDGGTASDALCPTHVYEDDGTYAVTLTITDANERSWSDVAEVTVSNVAPTAEAGPAQIAEVDAPVSFDGSGTTDPGVTDLLSFLWDFGDGTVAEGRVASHTYAAPGVYTVTLTVSDDDGGQGVDASTVTVGAGTPPNVSSALGMNLSGVTYYMSEMAFVDVFWHSMPWLAQRDGQWNSGETLDLTPEGWVASLEAGQCAGTLMCREIATHYPAGEYVCLYEGQGTIELGFDAKTITSSEPGRIVFDVVPEGGGIYLKIVETDPADPVRNIRVVMPGFEDTYLSQPFHPDFLARWKDFKILRFMDWMRTNNSAIQEWQDRATPSHATQASGRGVALEHMVRLSNELGADPWFCVPHQATDDYVRALAAAVRDSLRPDLRIYIEYSNEVWNFSFEQTPYALAQGLSLALSDNDFQATLRYYSQRSVEIFGIWEEVFGSTDRLVRVLGAQSSNPWTGTTIMDWQNAYEQADALAIAPYFGNSLGDPATQDQVAGMTVQEILDDCRARFPEISAYCAEHAQNASARGLDLIAYEGGQHLAGRGGAENNDALTALFQAANRDAGMKSLYLDYHDMWRAAGGKMFVAFASVCRYSKWGSWGVLEWNDQDVATAPKCQALVEWNAANPIWW